MTPTMPPAVQHRTPAPAPAARNTSSLTPQDPRTDATDFRQELVRQRKAKAEKSKPRDPAEATKAPAKAQRAPKARKARAGGAKADADASQASSDAAGAAGNRPTPAAPQESPVASESDAPLPAPGADPLVEAHPEESGDFNETAAAAGAGATVRPDVPVDPAGEAAPEGDTTQSRQAVSGLAVTAAGAGAVVQQGAAGATDEAAGGQQDASPDGAEVAEDAPADGAPGSEPAGRGAKPQAAGGTFGQALEGASRRRDAEGGPGDSNGGDGAAGDGGASAASWMEELESAAGEFAEALSPDGSAAAAPHASHATLDPSAARAAMDLAPGASGPAGARPAPAAPAPDPTPPEARFAAANHENIVKGMHAEVMPNGGTMRIRLDPPQLGALQVTVSVRDGVVTASFETSNDEATRLLGHSLNQLKAVLESRGVGVDKLQVQQAPRDEHANAPRDDGSRHRDQTPYEQEHAARQEQQRKEMLEKMWRRLSGAADPLDVTV